MEICLARATDNDSASLDALLGMLGDENWRVRYAAAVSLGDRGDVRAIDALVEALRHELVEPLFSQPPLEGGAHAGSNTPYSVQFPPGTTEQTKEAWCRRGRLMQAICLALGNIASPSPAALELLHRLALDQKCDYSVRAASCKALGQLGSRESLPVLQQAATDEEWCTKCEAKKAIKRIASL